MINYIVKTLTAKTFEMHYNIHLNIAYNRGKKILKSSLVPRTS